MFEKQIASLIQNKDVKKSVGEIKELLVNREAGEQFKQSQGYSKELLIGLLKNEDPKVRKSTAVIMGVVVEPEFSEKLFEAYSNEETRYVRRVYLQSLQNYDYSPFEEALRGRIEELEAGSVAEDEVKHVAEELRALRKLVPDSVKAVKHTFRNPAKLIRVVLAAKKEVIPVLSKKVGQIVGDENTKSIFCGVMAATNKITALSKIRFYKDVLFPLNNMKPIAKSDIPAVIACGDLMTLLKLMHEEVEGPYRFRVTAKDLDLGMISAKIEALSGGKLSNSVSDYEIEIRLISGREGNYLAFLKLHTMEDCRFKYRKEHVAASIHPVNAATIVEFAKDYMKKDAQILDPCCGVGTMLIERHKLVPTGHIYGIDVFGKAIQSARVNAEEAGLDINYINRDYFDFTHEYLFDEIISNLPEFHTREEADDFYGRFLTKSETLLKEDGIIIVCSNEKNLIKKHLRLNENFKLLREFPLSEKEEKNIFILKKD